MFANIFSTYFVAFIAALPADSLVLPATLTFNK